MAMLARFSVIFYIILCLEVGLALMILPWYQPFGSGDWGSNYFLLWAVRKTGWAGLQALVASGWFRGAISGLGVLNIFLAFREILNFRQAVKEIAAPVSAKMS